MSGDSMEVDQNLISAKRSNSFSGVGKKGLEGERVCGRVRRNSADMSMSRCMQQRPAGQKFTNLFSSSSRGIFSSFPSRVGRKGIKRKRESPKTFPRSIKKQPIARSYVFNFPLMNSSAFNQPRGASLFRQTAELSCAVGENRKIGMEFPCAPTPLQVNRTR